MWTDFYKLLEDYDGDIDRATAEQRARAGLGLRFPSAALRIAQIYYHRTRRNDRPLFNQGREKWENG